MTEARERFEASTDFTLGLEEEFALVDPETLELVHRFEDIHAACQRGRPPGRVRRRRADLVRDRDPLREGRELRRGDRAPARTARAAVRDRPTSSGLPLAATGTHPWASYLDQQIIDTRALPAPPGGAAMGGAAQQHLEPPRARRACAAPTARSPSATTCAACCRRCSRCRRTRRSSTARDTGLHSVRTEIFTRTFPRCGVHEPFGGWDAYADFVDAPRSHRIRSSRRPSSGGACARITPSAPSSCGSATRRRAARSRSRSPA